ncbi:MAG: SagB/ThcOx family dehydrogenase [Clostridia bacterium]|nr:SagB/ThcOx family dehydrogenase [Clostridia bacterium]
MVDLPKPGEIKLGHTDLRNVLENRTSIRDYSNTPLSLEELSYLLWCTRGIKEILPNSITFRTVPSAGARHAFETYLLINRVEGIEPALYKFLDTEHKLSLFNDREHIAKDITKACLNQRFVQESAVTFIWVAVYSKMAERYRERSYKYLHLDAGHVCQNLYLSAESIGAGVCAIAAYNDDKLNDLLELDGKERFVIYIATAGMKK